MPNPILIFTDGASKGNPGPGGWGAVLSQGDKVIELGGFDKRTTNNRMELLAPIKALEYLEKSDSINTTLSIYSDSSYVINGITKWVSGWKRKGWVTTQKAEVLNRDLWERLDEISSRFSIKWQQVAGHADTPGNARADEIASAFGEGKQPELFSGDAGAYRLDLSNIGARSRSDIGGAKSGRSGKAYSYVSLVNGVIQIHKTWDECRRRVEGKKARFKKSLTVLEERQIIEEFKK